MTSPAATSMTSLVLAMAVLICALSVSWSSFALADDQSCDVAALLHITGEQVYPDESQTPTITIGDSPWELVQYVIGVELRVTISYSAGMLTGLFAYAQPIVMINQIRGTWRVVSGNAEVMTCANENDSLISTTPGESGTITAYWTPSGDLSSNPRIEITIMSKDLNGGYFKSRSFMIDPAN